MPDSKLSTLLSRRQALALGGTIAGGLLVSSAFSNTSKATAEGSPSLGPFNMSFSDGGLDEDTEEQIDDIIGAQGMMSNGVYTIGIDRDDIPNVMLHGIPIKPSFQINGALNFQALGSGMVLMNSDMALKASELDPFIDELLKHDIFFQAEHQHFYDFNPLVWFIHFRAVGDPLTIARGTKAALDVTSTPFPQTLPSNPQTSLPVLAMSKILGAPGTVGSEGVVTFSIPRADTVTLGGYRANPYLNIATDVVFEPFGGGNVAGAPDFGMIASEVQDVIRVMRGQGWDTGCLYNQETDEHPQLFFSHNIKTGDPIVLAHEVRNGLNRMNMMFMS